MLTQDTIDAFNNRLTIDLNSIKKMTPAQLDKVKHQGSQAEALLANRDFALFVHTFKFERMDQISEIQNHTEEDNTKRIAIANQIAGVDEFVKSLRRAVYFKDRVVSQQNKDSVDPNSK
jgi:hypothetical protein